MSRSAIVLLLSLWLGGCLGPDFVGAGTERAAFVEAGATRIAADQRATLLAGNTLVAEGVRVHYAPDGRKIIRLDDGFTIERAWRVRDDGVMCEELTVSGAEVCADQGILYERDGVFRAFHLDGRASAMAFRIAPGDALQPVAPAEEALAEG
ncbi:MAG: hypothetical protein EA356_16220 [Geminicoccaceae bacterium]|nr:MAG: hypothetical protein EA356_16220 [Geminicoccaceae bacterium]